jgi:hypothetical protein
MITRIRYVKIKPGCIEEYKKLALDWQNLIKKYGGKVIGFYYDKIKGEVIGIAEYENSEKLTEIQSNCENDPSYIQIKNRIEKMVISAEEQILEKLEFD